MAHWTILEVEGLWCRGLHLLDDGVLQSSVMGPTLFLAFTDLPDDESRGMVYMQMIPGVAGNTQYHKDQTIIIRSPHAWR